MRPYDIAIFLGLAVLEVAGCHPILVGTFILFNPIAPDSTNAILNRDDTPAFVSDALGDKILTAAGLLGIAVRVGSPIHNSSPPATLYEDGKNYNNDGDGHCHDAGIGKTDTPTLIGGVLIGACKERFSASEVEEITKRESAGHS
ncbi:hypothetical protein BELL_1078g00030 [Botrytis elliptica]|uniref:Uncharacterized protein n=1 Tax=Botrytis elliptica TaxID=278938 RepID=A0A4Z1IVN5_9HELO|nr:hypothetical protein EAE99_004818 [Botrytis elliptica]TGO63440.1 hypothetical protein BELL_1078g00030 [Botrytis elliptica]